VSCRDGQDTGAVKSQRDDITVLVIDFKNPQ
jgi:hypothetical protein